MSDTKSAEDIVRALAATPTKPLRTSTTGEHGCPLCEISLIGQSPPFHMHRRDCAWIAAREWVEVKDGPSENE